MATDKKRGGGAGDGGEYQADGEMQSTSDVRTGIIELSTGPKAVQYSVVDGLAIFEGDIVLGTVEQVEARTQAARSSVGLPEAVVRPGASFRWPKCRIPYTIDPSLTSQSRVTEAIAHWEANTNFRFVVRTTEADFVTFRPASGCSSEVGRQGGQQFVNLGSGCLRGQVIHEIGHVVGLWHEQSREDRDTFVQIIWANIEPGKEHNFNQHIVDGDDVGAYDYGSIMHYSRTAFSFDNVSPTILPINPASATIGQRTALSAGDIAAANSLCSSGGIVATKKEVISDPVTRKELIKDLTADTKKELIHDTLKELVADKRFDPIDPFGPRKFDQINPRGGGINRGTVLGGALPFAMATGHQAPGAGQGSEEQQQDLEQAMLLDAQLQQIAEALAQTQAAGQSLQQQYDETYALLQAIVAKQQGS
ncbi:MAG TPA: M12 family metallopeptidase [Thermoanaerobaculia bacterium]|nr:M12 family metallopeptidase [Thermoanaerobaculia bacterium]